MPFLNSDQAKQEKTEEIREQLHQLADLSQTILALKQVIAELALENAHLRIELKKYTFTQREDE